PTLSFVAVGFVAGFIALTFVAGFVAISVTGLGSRPPRARLALASACLSRIPLSSSRRLISHPCPSGHREIPAAWALHLAGAAYSRQHRSSGAGRSEPYRAPSD